VNHLDYADMKLAVLECVDKNKKIGKKNHFVWVTNMEVSHANYFDSS